MEILNIANISEIPIEWNKEKNEILKKKRGITFEKIKRIIKNKEYIAIVNNERYKNQNNLCK